MQCVNCALWQKREIKSPFEKGKKKEYYPTGWCLHRLLNTDRRYQLTTAETNCGYGVK